MPAPVYRPVPGTPAGPCRVLLEHIARGDRDAFARLYDRMAPAVYVLARRRSTTDLGAEHVVQEAFLHVWRSAPLFLRQDRTAEAWILDVILEALGAASNTSTVDS